MECLYDDLNNYEDVRTLEELHAKNKELQVKLEEHSAAKKKLQKDYDNLKIEFKQLEINYSSVLKNAWSELQRKAQTTTPITTEKDLMVSDTFKSGKNIVWNFDSGVKNPGVKTQDRPSKRNNKTKEDNVKQKNVDIKKVRREAPVLPVKDVGPNSNHLAYFISKNNDTKPENTRVNIELSNKRKSNVNDNIVQHRTELKEPLKTSASSITARKKSTLTVSNFPSRKLPDDYPSQECGRYQGRSLESLPPETSSYSSHKQTKSDCDRYPRDQEKSRYCHDDKYSAKYRSKLYDETLLKRQKSESYEIKSPAAKPLGDPRVTSNRYVIRKENGREVLTTVVGRNIDIIRVNKVMWNIKPVDIPVALLRQPSQCNDQLAKDINMELNNLVTNLDEYRDSGKVLQTGEVSHKILSKVKKIQHNTQDLKISKQPPEEISKQPAKAETVSKSNITKYRNSKIRQSNKNTHSKLGVPIIDQTENVPYHKDVNNNRKGEAGNSVPKELLPQVQQYNKREGFVPNSKLDGHIKSKSRKRSESQYQSTLTGMAGDLELGKDISDHMNINTRVAPEKVQKDCEIPSNMNEVRSKDSVNNVENKTGASSPNTEVNNTDCTKKQSKSKDISKDSVENTGELIQVLEKKRKSKKEKKITPKETKEKFCDLFGDSSSLITPEDLEIPSYLPISEDAQDDVKINQIAAPVVSKDEIPARIPPPNRVEITIQKTKAHEDIQAYLYNNNNDIKDKNTSSKTLTYAKLPSSIVYENLYPGSDLHDPNVCKTVKNSDTNIKVSDIQNAKDIHLFPATKKFKDDILKPSATFPSIVYENLYPGSDLNDPNVVIISTGTQPKIEYENKTKSTKNTKNIHLFPATKKFQKDILKSFATFTAQEFSTVSPLAADAVKPDVICHTSQSQAFATIMNADPVVNQTEKNTSEKKRRRKVVKRPPTTHDVETRFITRREAPVLPVKDVDPDSNRLAYFISKNNENTPDNTRVNVELSNKRKSNVNDNIVQHRTELKEPLKTSASSITARKKSTLTVSNFPSRKLPDDYPSHECGRYQGRSLESLPPVTSSYSSHQHTNSAHQSDYDRYLHDQEKRKYYHDDKSSAKYRSKLYDETLLKRQKTESYETKATAATPLGAPRVTSNRYVIRKENGREVLTTVVGRNIDIMPVNKVMWNIKPVDIPVPLLRQPSQCNDQLAKDINMELNNLVTNLDEYMDSGEVLQTGEENHEILSKVKKIQHNNQDLKISKQPPGEISKQPAKAETVSKSNITKYQISKIWHSNKNTHSQMSVPIIDLAENVPHHKDVNSNRKGEAGNSVPKELLPHVQQYNKREDLVPNSKLDGHIKLKSRKRSKSQYQSTLTGMAGMMLPIHV